MLSHDFVISNTTYAACLTYLQQCEEVAKEKLNFCEHLIIQCSDPLKRKLKLLEEKRKVCNQYYHRFIAQRDSLYQEMEKVFVAAFRGNSLICVRIKVFI
jgi:hypothetical protein